MKTVNRFGFVFLAAVLALCAAAGIAGCSPAESAAPSVTDNLTWVMPTQNTDGSALPLSGIAKTTVAWGAAPGGPYPNTQDVTAPATMVALLRPAEGYGTRCYKVAVTTTAALGSVQGLYSGEACKTVNAPPNAPTGLAVQ